MLNFQGKDQSCLPSWAEIPRQPPRVMYRYCFTPPISAGMIDEWDIGVLSGFGVSQTGLPVTLSRATSSADPPVAMITRSPSSSGHWPLYQAGMVAL